MIKPTFLSYEKPLLTCMVQADNPDRIKALIDASIPEGAEAIGMQFCKLKSEYRNEKTYKELFAYSGLPVYVTNYRDHISNIGKSDDVLAAELLNFAKCGATLCDVMGDLFDACDEELTMNEEAIKKQMVLIEELHKCGAEVLMSSHVRYASYTLLASISPGSPRRCRGVPPCGRKNRRPRAFRLCASSR